MRIQFGHYLKMIWSRKKKNFMTMLGIAIAFVVLFIVTSIVVYGISNYSKPLGFEYQGVDYLSFNWENQDLERDKQTMLQIDKALSQYPEIESFCHSHSYLFMPTATSIYSLDYEGRSIKTHIFYAGDKFAEVMKITLKKGRWFGPQDNASSREPIIINSYFERKNFGEESGLGKILKKDDNEYIVIGIIDKFRNNGKFTGDKMSVFRRISLVSGAGLQSYLNGEFATRILLRFKTGIPVEFEEKLVKDLTGIAKDWTISIKSMAEISKSADLQNLILPIILVVVSVFMIVNVALGLFGVVWYNVGLRKAEIGLRRAMGSSKKSILLQILGEVFVLTTLSVLIASFFVLQFPLLNIISVYTSGIYLTTYLASLIIIYLISGVCASYPSLRAASIEPAQALHYE